MFFVTVAAASSLHKKTRSLVSLNFQRKFITLCAVTITFGVFELVATLYKKGPIAGGVSAALVLLLFLSQVQRRNPNKSVLSGRFAEYLSLGILHGIKPALVSVITFAVFVGLKSSNDVAGTAALVGGGIVWWLSFKQPIPQVVDQLVRGRTKPVDVAETRAAEFDLPKTDEGITWGGLRIPSSLATSHFMVVGTTGSGKTVTLRLLMQEVLQQIGTGADHRALIYDAKQDLASQIPGMKIPGAVYTLNPFDERCVAWDMAADIKEPTAALQAAATLIPSEKNASQPFFVDSAQLLLYGVMLSFIRSGADWRFSDLIRAMQTVDRLRRVLEQCPETRHIMGRFEHNRETLDEVMATVATKLTPYEAIAAMWDAAHEKGNKISLSEWVSDRKDRNCVLLLGNNERARAAMDRVNQVIFKRVTELLLDLEEDRAGTRRNWIFLDELADAGKLEGLPSLLMKGRSKGVCAVLGFQDIDSLKEVYGENVAGALTSQCNCKALLRLESPKTGEWAAKLFGDYEAIEVRRTESFSRTSGSTSGPTPGSSNSNTYSMSSAEQYNKRQSVMESEFFTIPPTGPDTGMTGYYLVPGMAPYRHTYPGGWLFTSGLAGISDEVQDLELRAPDEQWLGVWDEADAVKRLIVAPEAPQAPVQPPSQTPPAAPAPVAVAPVVAPAPSAPVAAAPAVTPAPPAAKRAPSAKRAPAGRKLPPATAPPSDIPPERAAEMPDVLDDGSFPPASYDDGVTVLVDDEDVVATGDGSLEVPTVATPAETETLISKFKGFRAGRTP